MTAVDDLFLAGVHVAKTAGSTVAEHARTQLGEPDFYYYDRFTRTRRFWADIPQYEELTENEKNRIRMIFGHGVCFSLVKLQGRIPEFFTSIRHPVPFLHSRYTHQREGNRRRFTDLSPDAFLKNEKHNHFSWRLVKAFGELAEFGDEISYRNSASILRNFKYIFATEAIDAQSPALWNALGVSSRMERRRVASQREHVPITDDEILAMHDVDLQLYEQVAALRARDVDRGGALNPFGYKPERYFDKVIEMRQAAHYDRGVQIEAAYCELSNQLFLDFDLEAAIERLRYDAPHVREPALLRKLFVQKYEQSENRYNERQREASRRKAEAIRGRRYAAAAGSEGCGRGIDEAGTAARGRRSMIAAQEISRVYASKKPIVLLSIQRSGTNFLRRVIGSHPAIDPLFGEIFDPNHNGKRLSFFNFYQRAVVDDPALCLPDNRIVAFEKYIQFLDENVPADHYVLDIKYASLRQMESYWPTNKEVLTQYIIDKQWPVIHLIRTDLLAAVLSHMRARETGVWLTKKADHSDTFSTAVDPVGIVNSVVVRRQAIQRYRRDFQGARLLELVYEEIVDAPNGISEPAIDRIREFLGVTDEFSRTPETRKLITRPLSQAIENYDDVLATAANRKVALTMSI